jgi:hypothetical protein
MKGVAMANPQECVEPRFPRPVYAKRERRWRLSDLVQYEAAQRGEEARELDPACERYLTAAQVRERYGGVSDMWLWRRLNQDRTREQEAANGRAS